MCLPCANYLSVVKALVIMPKRRSTLPIAHSADLPTIAFTDEEGQAIEHAYGRKLNAGVRQQITTVTTQYLKDCAFEPAAPKAMAQKRIEQAWTGGSKCSATRSGAGARSGRCSMTSEDAR